ncbi:MAG: hypothetical protein HUJ42_00225 [Malacoplasma sp.]|nr:hypothetical protein [Malacoplasma sp.]
MPITIKTFKNFKKLSKDVKKFFKEQLRNKPNSLIGMDWNNDFLKATKNLKKVVKLNFSQAKIFALSCYLKAQKLSLDKELVDKFVYEINIPMRNYINIHKRLVELVDQKHINELFLFNEQNGVDLLVFFIDSRGNFACNDYESKKEFINLTNNGLDILSIGLKSILSAKRIICFALDEAAKDVVLKLNKRIIDYYDILTYLHLHNNITLYTLHSIINPSEVNIFPLEQDRTEFINELDKYNEQLSIESVNDDIEFIDENESYSNLENINLVNQNVNMNNLDEQLAQSLLEEEQQQEEEFSEDQFDEETEMEFEQDSDSDQIELEPQEAGFESEFLVDTNNQEMNAIQEEIIEEEVSEPETNEQIYDDSFDEEQIPNDEYQDFVEEEKYNFDIKNNIDINNKDEFEMDDALRKLLLEKENESNDFESQEIKTDENELIANELEQLRTESVNQLDEKALLNELDSKNLYDSLHKYFEPNSNTNEEINLNINNLDIESLRKIRDFNKNLEFIPNDIEGLIKYIRIKKETLGQIQKLLLNSSLGNIKTNLMSNITQNDFGFVTADTKSKTYKLSSTNSSNKNTAKNIHQEINKEFFDALSTEMQTKYGIKLDNNAYNEKYNHIWNEGAYIVYDKKNLVIRALVFKSVNKLVALLRYINKDLTINISNKHIYSSLSNLFLKNKNEIKITEI